MTQKKPENSSAMEYILRDRERLSYLMILFHGLTLSSEMVKCTCSVVVSFPTESLSNCN